MKRALFLLYMMFFNSGLDFAYAQPDSVKPFMGKQNIVAVWPMNLNYTPFPNKYSYAANGFQYSLIKESSKETRHTGLSNIYTGRGSMQYCLSSRAGTVFNHGLILKYRK